MMQQLYFSWATIQGGIAALADVIRVLEVNKSQKLIALSSIDIGFRKNIEFQNVSFNYPNTDYRVLNSINMVIEKGSRVGIIGASGSGKSTLIDILMGLIPPTSGSLLVDNAPITQANVRYWQNKIAHVPQVIFLTDKSIAENIAFGIPIDKINHERVREAAAMAQISGIIEDWPNKYFTLVGERGIKLSGGQRQRIGIARALYKRSEVIVLDEATSALDEETEADVMKSVDALSRDLTLIIVAHRLSTLKNCNYLLNLKGGELISCDPPEKISS
jgi:ATP-binding cassette subfamily B protein